LFIVARREDEVFTELAVQSTKGRDLEKTSRIHTSAALTAVVSESDCRDGSKLNDTDFLMGRTSNGKDHESGGAGSWLLRSRSGAIFRHECDALRQEIGGVYLWPSETWGIYAKERRIKRENGL
jgi:hypothetical protein